MRKTALGLAMFVGLAATMTPSPGYAADAGTYDLTLGVVAPWFSAGGGVGNVAVDVAGNAIAVGDFSFHYRHVNGHWSQEYRLPVGGGAKVAAGRAGMAVVAGDWGRRLSASIRRTDATWTTPYALDTGLSDRHTGVDVAANADGDYAVSWTQPTDRRAYVAVRLRGGTWHRFVMGAIGAGPTRVGIDAAGNVTVARTVVDSATQMTRLVARRKPVSGPAGATFQVSRAGDGVGSFDQIIERTGRRTYAYQYGPPVQGQYAASRVLRQASIGGPLTQVWSNAASSMPSIAADGGRLRVVWIEQPDPNAPAIARTQAFNPTAGTPVTITDAPTNPLFTGVAINRYGVGVLAVGKGQGNTGSPDTTKVSPVTAGTVGPSDWLDDNGPSPDRVSEVHPVLGAGGQYFIGLDGLYFGPTEHYVFLVFHGQLP